MRLKSIGSNDRFTLLASLILPGLLLVACANLPEPITPSPLHITPPEPQLSGTIPPLTEIVPLPPLPVPAPAVERYSVVVNNVLAQEVLFALARDAKLDIEIHPNINGTVTMNLIDRTLPEILDAIARQVDMRYELNGGVIAIMPDSPFLKNYRIEYPNVQRNARNSINMSTSIAVIGKGENTASGSNGSNSGIENLSNNQFWDTLTQNIKDILRETDKHLPEGLDETDVDAPLYLETQIRQEPAFNPTQTFDPAFPEAAQPATMNIKKRSNARQAHRATYREAAYVITNPETGIISVRATSRQHASIREFIAQVINNARRQVLIEATIVEVTLSNQYQQGIDWQILRTLGLSLSQTSPAMTAPAMGTLQYINPAQQGGFSLFASIKLLETFGKLHVLSSPKLSVLNNQTSLLKVVDESVYFTIEMAAGTYNQTTGAVMTAPSYTTTVHTIPVGFMMYVTPQIGSDAEVTLNLRPTITRILSYARDPNPALINQTNPALNITNLIPQIQTREMESILRVRNGSIAVLGGLMQDTRGGDTSQIPGLGGLPGLGEIFKARNDSNKKTELVIFLRPTILDHESQYEIAAQFRNSYSDKNSPSRSEWQNTIRQATP